jgi:hypothetical protein
MHAGPDMTHSSCLHPFTRPSTLICRVDVRRMQEMRTLKPSPTACVAPKLLQEQLWVGGRWQEGCVWTPCWT